MGYYSDVAIGYAFPDEKTAREVIAVYSMSPQVQKAEVRQVWRLSNVDDCVLLFCMFNGVKWYSDYSDVQAINHMQDVVANFNGEREDFAYAYRFVRIGEDFDDVEIEEHASGHNDYDLAQELWDRIDPVRYIEVKLPKGEKI